MVHRMPETTTVQRWRAPGAMGHPWHGFPSWGYDSGSKTMDPMNVGNYEVPYASLVGAKPWSLGI